jgi:hypothetical protein
VQVLASQLRIPLDYEVVDFNNMVNYGSDRLRFPTPVPSGCKIRARARIKAVEQVKSGVQATMELNIHVVGQDRPAVINDLVILTCDRRCPPGEAGVSVSSGLGLRKQSPFCDRSQMGSWLCWNARNISQIGFIPMSENRWQLSNY